MGQQPQICPPVEQQPRHEPKTAAPRRWRSQAGVIVSPEQRPQGSRFGHPGPDAGWAYQVLDQSDLAHLQSEQLTVLARLMIARASRFGRAPVPEDLEVAKLLVGFSVDGSMENVDWDHWVEEAGHEISPGLSALLAVDRSLLDLTPAELAHR